MQRLGGGARAPPAALTFGPGELFTVFTLREGQIVHLRDHAHRADALADAGLDGHQWR